MTGHRSIFPAQILSIRKSSSIEVAHGARFGSVQVSFRQQYKNLTERIKKALKRKRR